MSLEDLHDELSDDNSDRDVIRTKEVPVGMQFRLLDDDPIDCDDITDEGQFPMFGSFLPIEHAGEEKLIEVSKNFVGSLIEVSEPGSRIGSKYRVDDLRKHDGVWQWDVSLDRRDSESNRFSGR